MQVTERAVDSSLVTASATKLSVKSQQAFQGSNCMIVDPTKWRIQSHNWYEKE